MARRYVTLAVVAAAVLSYAGPAGATGRSAKVPATSDVYLAGMTSVPHYPGGAGTLPVHVKVQAGVAVTFASVKGMVGCADSVAGNGPDGTCPPSPGSNITAKNNISGYKDSRTMVFVGVFTTGKKPTAPTPPTLVFADSGSRNYSHSFSSIAPELDQVFFIGDGLTQTGRGTRQRFLPPANASVLFLGFADSYGFHGPPSYYADDAGTLTVTFASGAS
jgi:hypothetical protein